jgi:hypothetical protein
MSDETNDTKTVTVAEIYRLKHELGQSITWGNSGLNALQVEELTKLTAEDYARIRNRYPENRTVVVFPTYSLFAMVALCAAAYFFFNYGWVKVPAVVVGITCLVTVLKREGHAEGYIEGYQIGHDEGIHKVLGIKPEEADKMYEFATKMKIDEMVVGRMNEREKKSAGSNL